MSSSKADYAYALSAAMTMLAQEPNSVFMGQAVAYEGTAMFKTLGSDVKPHQRLEMPVTEDMQMGMAIGMALDGMLPVCIYPRFNFLLLAASQLVLHLDKLPLYSDYRPKVIIRTAVAAVEPLNPGPQHLGDFSGGFRQLLRSVNIVELRKADQIVPKYRAALEWPGSSLMVEYTALYA